MHAYMHTHIHACMQICIHTYKHMIHMLQRHFIHASATITNVFKDKARGAGAEREAKGQIDSWIYFFSAFAHKVQRLPPLAQPNVVWGGDCYIHSIEP